MNTPRRNYASKKTSRATIPAKSRRRWTRLSKIDTQGLHKRLANSSEGTSRRLFAIVSRPESSFPGAKQVRRVLLFDNHPDTLRLLFAQTRKSKRGFTSSDLGRAFQLLLAVSLISILASATLWPLFSR
jgi:hypothetical protein